MIDYSIVIPARYESSRFPGKPLADIAGKPMIVRTWEQCANVSDASRVYVATDDARVERVCTRFGISVIMTPGDCLTGTDRVAACSDVLDSEVVINVQGDEPIFNPRDVHVLIDAVSRFPGEVLNGYCPISTEEEYLSRKVPKVVFAPDNRLLYMSRGPVPSNKNGTFGFAWRQVCAYAFPRESLKRFAAEGRKTPLEESEDIEILRFLELGIPVRMVPMSDHSIPVDFPEDVQKVEKRLRELSVTGL